MWEEQEDWLDLYSNKRNIDFPLVDFVRIILDIARLIAFLLSASNFHLDGKNWYDLFLPYQSFLCTRNKNCSKELLYKNLPCKKDWSKNHWKNNSSNQINVELQILCLLFSISCSPTKFHFLSVKMFEWWAALFGRNKICSTATYPKISLKHLPDCWESIFEVESQICLFFSQLCAIWPKYQFLSVGTFKR